MSGGLAALLDDIAALAKMAAASVDDVGAAAGRASAKAAGVVIDDTAVTPRYVQGFTADRELPVIKRIALGSLRNKLLFILPAIMLLSEFVDWAVSPLLMLGGAYLCFEGAEKIWEKVAGHGHVEAPAIGEGGQQEEAMVKGAIRTDFILSAEIMVIALREVAAEAFLSRLVILIVVAIAITLLVYGAVALIVKLDDIGLSLAQRASETAQRIGRAMVKSVPKLMAVLATVGIIAMIWVGGHILLVGFDEVGWKGPYDLVHHAEDAVNDVGGIGGVLGWLVNTALSFVAGLIVGAILVLVMHLIPRRGHGATEAAEHGDPAGPDPATSATTATAPVTEGTPPGPAPAAAETVPDPASDGRSTTPPTPTSTPAPDDRPTPASTPGPETARSDPEDRSPA